MTLLFEDLERANDHISYDLVGRGAQGISLLEFFGVEESVVGSGASVDVEESESDARARERARQLAAMVDAAREEASSQTRRELEGVRAGELARERGRIDHLSAEFARDRQRYFAAAETQVVKLALAVAARVLAREVASDPMHLASIVKAALAKIQDGSSTVLRVVSAEAGAWAALLEQSGSESVTVVPDGRLSAGECVLETSVGKVELGVEAQMVEIERGFRELMPNQGE